MYIAIEGIDTAGKSTQIEALTNHFSDAIVTKEPGATPIGVKIRELVLEGKGSAKTELLLFLADRAEHIATVIEPNYKNKLILSDRSAVSGIAYALQQNIFSKEKLVELNHFATNKLYPDTVFLLQLTQKELEFRLSQKTLDGIELRGVEYLLKIQQNLIEAANLLDINLVIIDATKPKEKITQEILEYLNNN